MYYVGGSHGDVHVHVPDHVLGSRGRVAGTAAGIVVGIVAGIVAAGTAAAGNEDWGLGTGVGKERFAVAVVAVVRALADSRVSA